MNHDEARPISGEPFRRKPAGFFRRAGHWCVEKGLVLYYVGTDERTPGWAKVTLAGALLYVISPVGLALDFLPPLGEGLDFGALFFALGAFLFSIKKHHLAQARATTLRWFGGLPPPSPAEPPVIDLPPSH